jgi:CRP/FNR family transcriptional regulator, cyclic AMP receptor protein
MMDSTALVADFPVLSRLTSQQLARVQSSAATARFAAGERVFAEGGPAVGCWLIHVGRIAIDVLVPGRGLVVVQTLGPGDVLGWSWLVPPYRWQFGATAAAPTTATVLDTTQLRALAEEDPEFGYALSTTMFSAMLQRLQATRARLLDLYRSPRDQR